MRFIHFVVVYFIFLSRHVFAINILAIISLPLQSHFMAFKNLFHELASRGHSVTVMNTFPDQNTTNLEYIDLEYGLKHEFTTLEEFENMCSWTLHLANFAKHFTMGSIVVSDDCDILFNSVNAKHHLASRRKYDVIFVEQFVSDCALAYAASHYDAPIIGLTSHVLLPWTYSALGIPFDVSSFPYYFSSEGPQPSLLAKLQSSLMNLYINFYGMPYILHKPIYDAFEKYMPNVPLNMEQIVKDRMKMVFAYQHFSMTGARLLAPQVLEIGGIHITNPKTVPKDIEDFLSDADHGAIYVSFGSNLRTSSMSEHMLQNFLAAFSRIPQKVLFKWELDKFPPGHENILTRKWFPQLDVLCHPKVLAFVSHGGMLSTSEAAHCGKPVLTIPFFGDQFTNSATANFVGFGRTLLFSTITIDSFADTIQELTSPRMQENARRVSKQWHDRPMPVMDSAVYWTEYVARHRNAPGCLPTKYTSFFQYLLLDVICVLILILLLLISMIYVTLKLVTFLLRIMLLKIIYKTKTKRE
ncbi:hypothetical protein ACJJTC_008418 [Scirpophaga incertulas]